MTILLFFTMLGLAAAKGFDWEVCNTTTQTLLKTNASMAIDPTIFVTINGHLMSDLGDLRLTIRACDAICGSHMKFYVDTPSRLLTWLIPTILLVTNMEFTSLGRERFLMIVQLFGDPIYSLLSLISKIESWTRWARQSLDLNINLPTRRFALAMSLVEEVLSPSHMTPHARDGLSCPCAQQRIDELYEETAVEALDSRTHGTARTCFSIILYIVGVASDFIPALGGSSSPSGGKIAPAMLLEWLLPIILVNNVVGQFNSSRDPLRIVVRLKERIASLKHAEDCSKPRPVSPDWTQYLATSNRRELDSCQPVRGAAQKSPVWFAITTLPISIAFVTAFLVLYSAPTYLSCRHFMIMGIYFAWLLSPLATWYLLKPHPIQNPTRIQLLLAKDTIIAFACLGLLIASSCGLFNNCYCWSGILTPGHQAADVLNPIKQFNRNNRMIYPAMVGTSLFLQLCFFVWIRWVGRAGFGMMRMSESERMAVVARRQQSTAHEQDIVAITISESKTNDLVVVSEVWDEFF